eukprot:CAMPEP_0201516932 /NCGR_PEP_ID=MMETSP0161_2-20130828/8167_1 /ASSEMBLY_ACC=CAM_ASM_000251 /TAXON_ID=180227 /ORGANISM="Neoparamoeba aestuarina, Strain SoJaBio B1-5/56/2" /LENGTH=469 /DNA_ID=CAMNT_0047914279 /DNA_START=168 /DNA_END=1577 /DNA_ORIENTATION=+
MRLNFSHGAYEDKKRAIQTVRELSRSFRFTDIDFSDGSCEDVCGIAADTKGPEIRTGLFAKGGTSVLIEKGNEVVISTNKLDFGEGTERLIYMDYENLANELEVGQTIWVDDGHHQLEVISRQPDDGKLTCVAHTTGYLGTQKGVNIPYPFVSSLPSVTEKDQMDLKFAVDYDVNFVFASFIRQGSNIRAIRDVLGKAGAHIKIIAKIENQQGVENFDEILQEADGVMVARGDLGIEIPPQKVNVAQKMMIAKCNLAGKPVICATQMLESMVSAPRATRAECSDVINAVLDGADAVMLSGETAKGKYPVEALQLMSSLCLEAEVAVNYESLFHEITTGMRNNMQEKEDREEGGPFSTKIEAVAASAVTAAFSYQASEIIVVAEENTARAVAKYRPSCPILFVTEKESAASGLMLTRGIVPIVIPQDPTNELDKTIRITTQKAKKMEIAKQGSSVLVITMHNNKPHLIFT